MYCTCGKRTSLGTIFWKAISLKSTDPRSGGYSFLGRAQNEGTRAGRH